MLPLTRRAGGIQAYKLVIPASNPRNEPDPQAHEGYEWIYVLNGRLRLVLDYNELVLLPGEAAEFDTRIPHWFGAADAEPVEISSVCSASKANAHISAPAQGEHTQGSPGQWRYPAGAALPPPATTPPGTGHRSIANNSQTSAKDAR